MIIQERKGVKLCRSARGKQEAQNRYSTIL